MARWAAAFPTSSRPQARSEPSAALCSFAEEIGDHGPVRVAGGKTQWSIGRGSEGVDAHADVREVRAPSGIVSLEPAELIVRAGAGTTWGELDAALADAAMACPVDGLHADATLGGLFSVGHSGFRRIRYGHIRDLLLEARYVTASGELVKAGAPVVKNVSGFDMCRLLVGSLGTIGLIGEVVLRCGPRPPVTTWLVSTVVDPFAVQRQLYQPSFVGWTGVATYVCLEGSAIEVNADTAALRSIASDWSETAKPEIPGGSRVARRPSELRSAPSDFPVGTWLAEIGVGVVHLDSSVAIAPEGVQLDPAVRALNVELKRAYDPTGRLNPGVTP